MVGTTYGVKTYAGRTAITDAAAFIETLGASELIELECWSEAENTRIIVVHAVGGS